MSFLRYLDGIFYGKINMIKQVKLIGSSIGNCGRKKGCEVAPYFIATQLIKQENVLLDSEVFVCNADSHDIKEQQDFFTKTAESIRMTLRKNQFPLMLGGDHACAIGTWSGIATHLHENNQELALIWIDAHMDAHTPDTSDTGNLHGMPVAHLLGYGYKEFVSILSQNPKLKPENLVYFGIRSFESAEEELLTKLGVKIYYQDMLNEANFKELFLAELSRLSSKPKTRLGISLDLDGLDPEDIAAVGTPVINGISSTEFLNTLKEFDLNKLIAFEITEYNPSLDQDGKSMAYILKLIQYIVNH